jgi:hypothetical protein
VGGRLNNLWVSAAVKPWGSPARDRGGHGPGFFPRSGGGAAGRGPQPRSRELVAGGGLHQASKREKELPQELQLVALLHRRAGGAAAPPSARRAGAE